MIRKDIQVQVGAMLNPQWTPESSVNTVCFGLDSVVVYTLQTKSSYYIASPGAAAPLLPVIDLQVQSPTVVGQVVQGSENSAKSRPIPDTGSCAL